MFKSKEDDSGKEYSREVQLEPSVAHAIYLVAFTNEQLIQLLISGKLVSVSNLLEKTGCECLPQTLPERTGDLLMAHTSCTLHRKGDEGDAIMCAVSLFFLRQARSSHVGLRIPRLQA